MKIEWQEYLSVGVEEIDRQHQLLIESYNTFFAAYSAGQGDDEVIRLFSFLEEYVATHFSAEEDLQQRIGFPDYLKHRQQHLELVRAIAELKERLVATGPDPSLVSSAGLLMTGWLIEHISVMDRAIGRFMTEAAARGRASNADS